MGKLTPTLLLTGSLLAPLLHAQAEPPATAAPTTAAPTTAAPTTAAEAADASRHRLEYADQSIQETWARLSIGKRNIDPFGLSQDPELEPKKPVAAPKPTKYQNFAPTPFSEVVAAIPVNGVMPSKGRFLVKDRTFETGDTIPVRYLDKTIQVQIVKVSAESIYFKNLQSGELASVNLNLLPPGMQRGHGNTGPPGLQRDDPSAPLEVDVPPPTAATER